MRLTRHAGVNRAAVDNELVLLRQLLVERAEIGSGAKVVLVALLGHVESRLHAGLTQPLAHDLHGTADVVVECATNTALQLRVEGKGLEAAGCKVAHAAETLADGGRRVNLVRAAVIVDVVDVKVADNLSRKRGRGGA